MRLLRDFPRMEELLVTKCRFQPGAVEPSTRLTRLKDVFLFDSYIPAADYTAIGRIPSIEYLCLSGTNVGDGDLEFVKHLFRLRVLDLCSTRLKPRALTALASLKLNVLRLSESYIPVADYAVIGRIPSIEDLDLSGTNIGDEDLEFIKHLPGLRALYLRSTRITDRGLDHLKQCYSLHHIDISDTAITDRAVRELEQSRHDPFSPLLGEGKSTWMPRLNVYRKRPDWARMAKQDYDKAIREFSEALRVTPDDPVIHDKRGVAYVQKAMYDSRSNSSEDFNKAIEDFTRVIGINPNEAAFSKRATAYEAKKDYESALADRSEILRLNPDDAGSYNDRGAIYLLKKDYDRAIADLTQSLRLRPNNTWTSPGAFADRGAAYAAKKQYPQAMADYEQALRLDPKLLTAFDRLAWLLATCPKDEVRDGTRALRLAMKACDLEVWEESHALETVAAAYAECGDFSQAVRFQTKAIALVSGRTGYCAPTASDKAEAQKRLNLYQNGKPYRDP
jgi:tetratricopeptide (TPR) repeat protein